MDAHEMIASLLLMTLDDHKGEPHMVAAVASLGMRIELGLGKPADTTTISQIIRTLWDELQLDEQVNREVFVYVAAQWLKENYPNG